MTPEEQEAFERGGRIAKRLFGTLFGLAPVIAAMFVGLGKLLDLRDDQWWASMAGAGACWLVAGILFSVGRKKGTPPSVIVLRTVGFFVGLVPAGIALTVVEKLMDGAIRDSQIMRLYFVSAVCALTAGALFARAADKHRSRLLPVVHAVMVAVGFLGLDACIGCAGCTCQAMSKLSSKAGQR